MPMPPKGEPPVVPDPAGCGVVGVVVALPGLLPPPNNEPKGNDGGVALPGVGGVEGVELLPPPVPSSPSPLPAPPPIALAN